MNWRPEVDKPLDWREAIPQLEYLAYAMCDRGVQQVRQDEVLDLFARMREEYPNIRDACNRSPEEFLRLLEARTGILMEVGHVRHLGMLVPVYEFRHLTFQEYLAARALVDGRFPGYDPNCRLADYVAPLAGRTAEMVYTESGPPEAAVVENWREALRLCAAICSDKDVDSVLQAILTPLEDEPATTTHARAVLAALCLADEPNVSGQVAEHVLQACAGQVGGKDGTSQVITGIDTAAMELASTRWASVLSASLMKEFCRCESEVRWNLARLLLQFRRRQRQYEVAEAQSGIKVAHVVAVEPSGGVIGGTHDVETLVARLEDPDAGVRRRAAAEALSKIGDERVVVEMLVAHFGDPDAGVRRAVAVALGKIRDERVVEVLVARFGDPDAGVRRAVAEALGKTRDEGVVEVLVAHRDDPDAGVRGAVAEALITRLDGIYPFPGAEFTDLDAEFTNEIWLGVSSSWGSSVGGRHGVHPASGK